MIEQKKSPTEWSFFYLMESMLTIGFIIYLNSNF